MSISLRQRMHQDLQLAGLAESTQKMYLRAVRQLATHVNKPPGRITESEVRDYLLYLKNERKYSPSSLKIAASGIVFFYNYTVPRDWVLFKNLHIPRHQSLPDVLSVAEVRRLIDACARHTTRPSSGPFTRWDCVSRKLCTCKLATSTARMVVHVHRGKGAKDRYIPLPVRTLQILRRYWASHRNPGLAVSSHGARP